MKIAHLTYSDSAGGAAIGALRLHQAMINCGVDSHMFVIDKKSDDPRIYKLLEAPNREEQKAGHKLTRILQQAYGDSELAIRSFNLFGIDTSSALNAFELDIVQLHWIANNTIRLDDLQKISAPLVWKMPDMWPFCGAEHYINANEPQRHRLGYDVTKPGGDVQVDVDRFIWEYKRRCYASLSLTVTSPSRFLAREAHESKLLGAYDCHVIPNPFPAEYMDVPAIDGWGKAQLRAALGLPADRLVVLFAAYQTTERRKGFHHIKEMLEHHLPKLISPAEICFLVVGGPEAKTETYFDYMVTTEPTTSDQAKYISYLQASDLVLFPSEMDSTAMVVGEAMACGVPAVTFAVGGLVDLVHHGKSGYLAAPYDPAELAKGIVWWRNHSQKHEVAAYCRALVRSMHDQTRCIDRYVSLYETVLARARTGQSFRTATLYDRDAQQFVQEPPRQLLIVDPSVKDVFDSSHNTEAALAAHALATLHAMQPRIIGNSACSIPGIDVEGRFAYTAYDKLRSTADVRGGVATYEDIGHIARAERSYAILDDLITGKLGPRDAVFFPMTDRPSVDALLMYLVRHDSARLPSFHLLLMFERAEFLVGEYPIASMLRALSNTGYIDRRIFLYAETEPMARALAKLNPYKVEVLPPLPLLDPGKLRLLDDLPSTIGEAFAGPYAAFHASGSAALPEKKAGDFWVSSVGRGRRDKGWDRLPAIVEATRKLAPNSGIRFIVQRPRKMDGLDAEADALARDPDVILLDEIVENSYLDAVMGATDLVLLPYDRNVYGNRGSAFAWKAVANMIPLVVTRETALPEAIRWGNGIVASTDEQFAKAIIHVFEQGSNFRMCAHNALRAFVSAAIIESPIVRNIATPRVVKRETILVVGLPPAQIPSLGNAASRQINVVCLVYRFSAGTELPDFHPKAGDQCFLVLSMDISSGAASLVPDFLRDAIAAGRFREIVLTEHTPPGTREQLLACGATRDIIRSPNQSSLAPLRALSVRGGEARTGVASPASSSVAQPGADAKDRPETGWRLWLSGAGGALKYLASPAYWLINLVVPARYQGCVDTIAADAVKGWVYNEGRPNRRVALEVRIGGKVVATALADRARKDLKVGNGDGYHGFNIPLPSEFRGTEPRAIAVHIVAGGEPLRLSKALAQRYGDGSPVAAQTTATVQEPDQA